MIYDRMTTLAVTTGPEWVGHRTGAVETTRSLVLAVDEVDGYAAVVELFGDAREHAALPTAAKPACAEGLDLAAETQAFYARCDARYADALPRAAGSLVRRIAFAAVLDKVGGRS